VGQAVRLRTKGAVRLALEALKPAVSLSSANNRLVNAPAVWEFQRRFFEHGYFADISSGSTRLGR